MFSARITPSEATERDRIAATLWARFLTLSATVARRARVDPGAVRTAGSTAPVPVSAGPPDAPRKAVPGWAAVPSLAESPAVPEPLAAGPGSAPTALLPAALSEVLELPPPLQAARLTVARSAA